MIIRSVRLALFTALGLAAVAAPAAAATITADGTTCTLANAILAANTNSDTGGCTGAGGWGADIIILDADVTLAAYTTASAEFDDTWAGLPEISTDMTIEAGKGSVIQRDPSYGCVANDPHSFRLLHVTGEGGSNLTLIGIELRHGCAAPGDASSADATGGAIWAIDGSTLTLTDCTLEDNQVWGSGLGAFARGGAIFLQDAPTFGSTASFTRTRFLDNRANGLAANNKNGTAQGGALYVGAHDAATLADCELTGNAAVGGDGIGNNDATGGAIAFGAGSSDLTSITGCTFRDNRAIGGTGVGTSGGNAFGGAIGHLLVDGEITTLSSSIFEGNVAQGGDGDTHGGSGVGGAILCFVSCSMPSVSEVLLRGNQALGGTGGSTSGGDAEGGAVLLTEGLAWDSVSFDSNVARGGGGSTGGPASGGAMAVAFGSSGAVFANLTATGNVARGGDAATPDTGGDAEGGAFFISEDLVLRSATVADNQAVGGADPGAGGFAYGGGLYADTGFTAEYLLAAGGTVVNGGGGTSANDCHVTSSLTSGGANVVETAGTCAASLTDSTDRLGVDPLVAPLGDYGCIAPLPDGSCLPTMALDLDSTAIDRGDCSTLDVREARGFARAVDLHGTAHDCDSGAVEMQPIVYVDANATGGGNDGSSWADAHTSLLDALEGVTPTAPRTTAAIGDPHPEYWIAQGVYRPDVGVNATADDPATTFPLSNGTSLYGGFVAGETSLSERDPAAHPTVLSGDIDENDTVDAHGVTADWNDIVGTNAYHLLTASSTPDASLILDGLVLTGGAATGGTSNDQHGADLLCTSGGAVTLRNIRVIGNQAADRGAIFGCAVEASDSSFENNHADNVGTLIADADFRAVRSRFTGNVAGGQGSLFYLGLRHLTLSNSVVADNQSGAYAGAIRTQGPTELTNVVFSGNSAGDVGSVLQALSPSDVTMTNVTVSGNGSDSAGAIAFQSTGHLAIRNSILWNNRTGSTSGSLDASLTQSGGGSVEIRNSILQGSGGSGGWIPSWTDGGGNLDVDPLFDEAVDPATAPTPAGDLRLRLASPAIDAGDDSAVTTSTDLDGDTRITGSAVDMGPWERPGELFSDDFETGNVCRWSTNVGGVCV